MGARRGCPANNQPRLLLVSSGFVAVSGANMLSQHGDVASGGAGLSAVSFTNTSVSSTPTPGPDNRGCENGALMDSFGIFLQGLLAVMAFSILMCEYWGGGGGVCW